MWYLDRHPFITVRTDCGLNHCPRDIAYKELDKFVVEGKPDLLVVDSNI